MDQRDRTILRLAVPALLTLAIEPVYVLVDTAIVGHLGTAPLGGLALAAAVLSVAFLVLTFRAYGTTARVAYLEGAGDARGAAGVAAQGLWLALGLGVVAAAVVAAGARALPALLGGEGEVLDAATTYLRISAIGAPMVLVALVGNGYLRGVQDTRTPLVVVLVANVLNVVVEVVLVYGLDLGVAGSAAGTVLAQSVAAGWFLVVLARRIVATGAGLCPQAAELAVLVRTGRHLFVRTASLLGALTLSTSVAARLDAASLGGHQIALQLFSFLALVVDGLAIAAQALTGSLLGAGRVDEARATARRMVRLGLYAGAVLAGAVVLGAPWVPRLFTSDPAVVDRARVALVLLGVAQVPGAGVFVLDGVLIGAADTRYQQWSNVAALAVFAPVAGAVLRWPGLGLGGLWAGLVTWIVARMVANTTRFRGAAWLRATGTSGPHVPLVPNQNPG